MFIYHTSCNKTGEIFTGVLMNFCNIPRFQPTFYDNSNEVFLINPLPHMPILGSSSSVANKDMMSKIWKNGDI